MKKAILLFITTITLCLTSFAQLNGDGYYRVKNYKTARYLYVLDDKASIDMGATSIDLNAIELRKGFEEASSDPSTIMYIKKVGDKYDITCQGTGINAMSGHHLSLRLDTTTGTYLAYASQDGMTKYLGDAELSDRVPTVYLKDTASGQYRLWYIIPVTQAEEQYAAIKPEFESEGNYFTSMFAEFSYSPSASGMNIYYISKVDAMYGIAIISQITDGKVPPATPVIINCTKNSIVDNKIQVGKGATQALTDNLLKGVYFENTSKTHFNCKAYDKTTMRLFGKKSDGKIGFITSNATYIPRNKVYLTVPEGTPEELTIMTQSEYDKFIAGVENITNNQSTFDIYNILGVKVKSSASDFEDLPAGIYVANGKKYIVK